MNLEFFRQIFKKSSIIKFHENPPSRSPVVPCWRTDMTKLIVPFWNSTNAPKNCDMIPQLLNTIYAPFSSPSYWFTNFDSIFFFLFGLSMTCVPSTVCDVQYGTYFHKPCLKYTFLFEYVLSFVHIWTQDTCIRQNSKRMFLTKFDTTHYIRSIVTVWKFYSVVRISTSRIKYFSI